MNLEEIKKKALAEIEEEDFRLAVAQYKDKLRRRSTLWDRLFPFKILIVKKGGSNG